MKKKSLRVVLFILPIMLGLVLYRIYLLAICIPPAIFTSILLYFLSLEDQMNYIDNIISKPSMTLTDIWRETR